MLREQGRTRAWLKAILVLAAALFAPAMYWYSLLENQQAESMAIALRNEARAAQLNEAVTSQADSMLRSVEVALRHLRRVYLKDPSHFDAAVSDVLSAYPEGMLKFVTVFGADGYLAYASHSGLSPAQRQTYFGDREHFRVPATQSEDAIYISEPIVGRLSGERLVQLTMAIREKDRLVGVIGIPLRLDYLSERLASLRVDTSDVLSILRLNASIIARSQDLDEALRVGIAPDRPYLGASPGATGMFRGKTIEGKTMLFQWRRLAAWPVFAIAAVDEQVELQVAWERQAQERRNAAYVTVAFAGFALLVLFLMLRLQRKHDEMGMSEARHRALFEESRVPILLIDPEAQRIVDANKAAEVFYGYARDQLQGMTVSVINQLPESEIRLEMRAAKEQRRDCFYFPHRLADGRIRQVEVRSGPITVENRTLLYSIIHDITDRHEAEKALVNEAHRLAALLDIASDGIHILDETGQLVQCSKAFADMLGYEQQQIFGLNVSDWDAKIPVPDLFQQLETLLGSSGRFETLHRRKDGTSIDVEITARGIEIDGKRYLYASSRDITERKRLESEMKIAATAFEAQEAMMVTSADEVILRVNHAFTAITGFAATEVVGNRPAMLHSGRHDQAFFDQMNQELMSSGHWKGEVWNKRKNGEVFPVWLSISVVKDSQGKLTHYVATFFDITQRKLAEAKIHELAFYDPLTQLPNRRLLQDRLQQALAASERSGRMGAVLFIDLDHFKTLNDTQGHAIGDLLLQQVARRLKESVREDDTVARLGGDEFVVLLEHLDPAQEAAANQSRTVAAKIQQVLTQTYVLQGHSHETTPSIGVALFMGHQETVDELLKRADLAMYQAKSLGRNTTRFFDPEMQRLVTMRARMERDLRAGIKAGQFALHYQPQLDAQGKVFGAEALLRWQHPELGMVSPADFIPVAEETGLIVPVGRWVLEQACRQLLRWRDQPHCSGLTLSVNVSARQFHHPGFVNEFREILAATQVDPSLLIFEITESLLLKDFEEVGRTIALIKALGIGISLDDFGTGYSSLAYLQQLSIDQLKIDKSFVGNILTDSNNLVIARAIINLAEALKLKVIAEGVEQQDQREQLAALGCGCFQGYLFGKPMSSQDWERFMQEKQISA